jgi:hypothetical protein
MSSTTSLPYITVCDDLKDQAQAWVRGLKDLDGIEGKFEVRRFHKKEFQRAIMNLERRRASLRTDGKLPADDEETPFDTSEVLVVDLDLFDFELDNQRMTGREVAYLARCYSNCGYIVGANLDKVINPFDLSLTDHVEPFIDLALGGSQVDDPSLWSDTYCAEGSFRPWSWPLIPERARILRSRAKDLGSRLDNSLEQVLGLPPLALQALTRRRLSALEIPDEPSASLSAPLRRWLTEATMGIDRKDVLADDEASGRVLAARLIKWFEAVLLPGQDVIVDAPHLIERRPGLLDGNSADPVLWREVCSLGRPAAELPLHHDLLAPFIWESDWVSRPVWLWPQLATDPKVDEARKAPRPDPRIVFAEDISGFIARDEATRFEARLDSSFAARWVARPKATEVVQYIPSSLMAAP